jgi:hypothetical protein
MAFLLNTFRWFRSTALGVSVFAEFRPANETSDFSTAVAIAARNVRRHLQ